MAVRPRIPAALQQELGEPRKQYQKRAQNGQREPRKKRKLYQPQSDDEQTAPIKASKSILKTKKRDNVTNSVPKTDDDVLMDRDDAEIDYWEAKLGQKKGAVPDELEDGLDDIFSGLDLPRGPSRLEEVSDGGESESGSEGDMQAFLDAEDEQESDEEEVPNLTDVPDDDFANFGDEPEEDDVDVRPAKTSIYKPYGATTTEEQSETKPSAYVPPALRNKQAGQAGQDTSQIQRQVKGQINRLSAVNISTIVNELESMYRSNPRGVINDTIANHLMDVVSDKSGLLDSFVILHAALVAALYKLHGTDFGALFVQRLVEAILACAGQELATGRRAINLMALMAELYNFNIVAATLPYDFIRMLLADLNELNVEILLVMLRSSGPQLRSDDPSALKDILAMLQTETKRQYGDQQVPLRMKFMVDTLLNLKNNKVSANEGQQAKELRTRMRKYIGGLTASTGQSGSEPLRVTLDDIKNVDTRGKWWLVGASWRNQDTTKQAQESRLPEKGTRETEADVQQEELLALARRHRLNNPIRKQIFMTLLSSSDYLEAITSLLSLRLKKSQESEITRVLVLLVGAENTYNPFYTHIAAQLADRHGMRISLQFSLWDFLRDCGESEIGQIGARHDDDDDSGHGELPSTRKIINVAKFYGELCGMQVLTLSVFKTLTFSRLQKRTRLFLDVVLSHAFVSLYSASKKMNVKQVRDTVERKKGSAQTREFEKRVAEIFGKLKQYDVTNGTSLVKGMDWFLRKVVDKGASVLDDDKKVVREGVEIARIVLSQ